MRASRLSFAVAALLLAGLAPAAAAPPVATPETGVGPVTKLPLPRYASLKTDRVNLREGPSKDHRTLWVFQRAGLPVEIVGEFETWRRIRDSEGTEGWVLHSLLSGRRTAIVNAGPDKGAEKAAISLRAKADEGAADEARLQTGVIGNVKNCSSGWCRLIVTLPNRREVDGYIRQNRLWGVYPNEVVE
ncbi:MULTISPECIES: SH3 domain-containing protein [unclassified Methylobacterium]|uniref:SH3 domain-containing protein n=1 Tax=unclassified Methylobacterium TaxID=2615210 RepID=UPI0011C1D6E3|nr:MULTISPECIES: SH3 domain-containing protein [unclassified Methylobacterium]QEE37822.1 SH3 domain-containing protein [Methylobacterium sp. WL1]TXN59472.1 SH3 domain-containing protein [Methylobacterium sp. WL2]